ncbi:hypothetical protein FOA52_013626 [Chlamydomonas sp. UWO 241]|nr:hypothetical protein FOA52_013626 [Chlamydomonas sp. UWO 241]
MMDVRSSKATSRAAHPALMAEMAEAINRGERAEALKLFVTELREMLLSAARRTLLGAQIRLKGGANDAHRQFFAAGNALGCLMFQERRFSEAEDIMKSVKRAMDMVRSVKQVDEAAWLYHTALLMAQAASLQEAEALLVRMDGTVSGLKDEPLSVLGITALVDIHTQMKAYTKAELLCCKTFSIREALAGPRGTSRDCVRGHLQLAAISMAQSLFEEAEGHAHAANTAAMQLAGPDSLDAADTYLAIGRIYLKLKRRSDGMAQLDACRQLREDSLGLRHPATLEARRAQADVLLSLGHDSDAADLLEEIVDAWLEVYGIYHESTLESLGALADTKLGIGKEDEARAIEKRIVRAGLELLVKGEGTIGRIDDHRPLRFVTDYICAREHLQEARDLFLAKSYVTYKERLDPSSVLVVEYKERLDPRSLLVVELRLDCHFQHAHGTRTHAHIHTRVTHKERLDPSSLLVVEVREKIAVVIAESSKLAGEQLEDAELYNRQETFRMAEMEFRRAYTLSKLINTVNTTSVEAMHEKMAMGLADALFGVGKVNEAKAVLKAAGLVKKSMRESIPTSYLRWMNKRVANYMDKAGGAGQEKDDEYEL